MVHVVLGTEWAGVLGCEATQDPKRTPEYLPCRLIVGLQACMLDF